MRKPEEEFTQELLENLRTAKELGISCARMEHSIAEEGGVPLLKASIARRRVTDSFDPLQKKGRLDLSAEAAATKACYQVLFSDEEVDFCLAMLCECGYYG